MFAGRRQSRPGGSAAEPGGGWKQRARAFTLIELLVAMGIAFTVLATLAFGYIQAYRTNDAAMLEAAGQRLAVERLEQVRGAEWKAYGTVLTNQLTNFVGTVVVPMNVPSLTTNEILASVTTQVTLLNTNLYYTQLYLIDVRCLWTNQDGQVYTNSVSTIRAPN